MLPNLGLVCITSTDELRYRSVTRKRLLSSAAEVQERILWDLYHANLAILGRAPRYCVELGIRLYRIPSHVFPFSDEPLGRTVLERMAAELAEVGREATSTGVRLVMHPDQFVVLNSDSDGVVANSFKILEMHGHLLDALEQPRSPWALLEIHGGKKERSEALVEAIQRLPASVHDRIALENDETHYGADEILAVCQTTGVPMVFDAHHHVCAERLKSYDHPSIARLTEAAARTWPDPAWQLVHISNGRDRFNDRQHADEVTTMPAAYANVPWIEVEAKRKEVAIRRLQRDWLSAIAASRST